MHFVLYLNYIVLQSVIFMDFLEILKIILLGVIEGITEWLPISSTGHMLLFDAVFPLKQTEAFKELFVYFIQLGAILAVIVLFFGKLCPFKYKKKIERLDGEKALTSDKQTWILWGKVLVACIPAAVIGLLWDMPDSPWVIATTLIVYGVAFIGIERWNKKRTFGVENVHDISWKQAAIIGCAQILSIIPGTSRSGITILAALLLGVSRPAGAEFTFFLAIPVMVGASLLKFIEFGFGFSSYEYIYLFIGFFVAFAVSLLCIKFLMNFVKKHDFTPFGWYRIGLGVLVFGGLVIPTFF